MRLEQQPNYPKLATSCRGQKTAVSYENVPPTHVAMDMIIIIISTSTMKVMYSPLSISLFIVRLDEKSLKI